MSSSPYQAYPSQYIEPPAVQLIAAGPARQRRLTVAFRLILVIPHLFALSYYGIGAIVIAFLGWWGALFTGRLPDFTVSFLSGFARWNARVYGYLYLLTDVYPPFGVDDDPGYPVDIAIPEPGRLNRFAVFFRFILMLWAYIVVTVVSAGANTILAFIAWLITLITGRLPSPLHLALTAVLRYQTRFNCYLSLLTPTYPWRLFGDRPETPTPAEQAWGARPTVPPAAWRLVLPGSAKALLIACIVLGLFVEGGWQIASAGFAAGLGAGNGQTQENSATSSLKTNASQSNSAGNSFNTNVSQWVNASNTLSTNMSQWENAQLNCHLVLACDEQADRQAASATSAFASQVRAIEMPPAAASSADRVVEAATKVAQDFTTLSAAASAGQYQIEFASAGWTQDQNRLQADSNSVNDALEIP